MSANKVAEMPINRGVGDFLKVYKIWETDKNSIKFYTKELYRL